MNLTSLRTGLILVLIAVLVAACGGGATPAPVERGLLDTNFTNLVLEGDLTVGDAATITGDAAVGDDLTVTGNVSVGDFFVLTAGTTISVTAGAIITPTASYQPLQSAGAVTTSTTTAIADGATTGQILVLRNINASAAITVDGAGGNVECNGNVALGANDVLTLLWNGSDWSCLALRDNSA